MGKGAAMALGVRLGAGAGVGGRVGTERCVGMGAPVVVNVVADVACALATAAAAVEHKKDITQYLGVSGLTIRCTANMNSSMVNSKSNNNHSSSNCARKHT